MQKPSRDGVALAYEDVGEGSPMVFVHGWSRDHTFFEAQVEQFSRAHRTVAVDLRGHGESDSPHQEYTMAGFADDVAWLCEELRWSGQSSSAQHGRRDRPSACTTASSRAICSRRSSWSPPMRPSSPMPAARRSRRHD